MKARLTTKQQQQMYQLIIEEKLNVLEICKRTGLESEDVYQWRHSFKDMTKKILEELSSDPAPSKRIRPRKKK